MPKVTQQVRRKAAREFRAEDSAVHTHNEHSVECKLHRAWSFVILTVASLAPTVPGMSQVLAHT